MDAFVLLLAYALWYTITRSYIAFNSDLGTPDAKKAWPLLITPLIGELALVVGLIIIGIEYIQDEFRS
jgi:hypothetical protein